MTSEFSSDLLALQTESPKARTGKHVSLRDGLHNLKVTVCTIRNWDKKTKSGKIHIWCQNRGGLTANLSLAIGDVNYMAGHHFLQIINPESTQLKHIHVNKEAMDAQLLKMKSMTKKEKAEVVLILPSYQLPELEGRFFKAAITRNTWSGKFSGFFDTSAVLVSDINRPKDK